MSAEGASGFCQTMPPSGRQLMSIGASEHRAFVRAKARFAGQKAQEHSFVRGNAVFTGHIAMYRWRHFRQSRLCHHGLHKLLRQADITDGGPQGVSVTPDAVGMRSETTTHDRVWRIAPRALPFPTSQRPTCPFSFAPGGTPPARPYAAPTHARCEPVPAFPLLPGPSTCPAWPSAASVAAGYEPFSANRLTPASRDYVPGTMAAGARSRCALKKRGISFAKTRRFRAADYSPRPAPVRGTFAVAWNIAVRTRGVFTHRTGFQKLACAERCLVRTGGRGGASAGGNRWR